MSGVELAGRCLGVAEADQDQGHAGASRGARVGGGVADQDCPRERPAGGGHGRLQVTRIRLGGGRGVWADDRLKQAAEIEGVQQGVGKAGGLVGAYREARAVVPQRLQCAYDSREGQALVGDVGQIAGDESIEERRHALGGQGRAGRLEAALQ